MTRRGLPAAARARCAAAICLIACGIGPLACGAEPTTTAARPLLRRGPFGSLRDFVLIQQGQPQRAGAALLVDRFEATQADWSEFAATPGGRAVAAEAGVGAALPASGMDLNQARAFAYWRLGRLPTEAEWRRVTAGGGNSPFPWGLKQFATHANTGDLGLGEAMAVGTFESGRRTGGDMPYDLIGNVREWTETVPQEWFQLATTLGGRSFSSVRGDALQLPALAVWRVHGLLPSGGIIGVGGPDVPRKVVGADFATPMQAVIDQQFDTQDSGARSNRTGLRVYTTVDELLGRLLAIEEVPQEDDRRQLIRFVQRDEHLPVLQAAFGASPMADAVFAPGSVASILAAELRGTGSESR